MRRTKRNINLILCIVIFFIVIIWSGIKPHDYFTWILEVFPGVIGFLVLWLTYRRFSFTNFVYLLVMIHCCILFVGGHYTYAEEPFFNWIKETFNLSRNNYDKLGHLAQGFFPAILTRELLIRLNVVQKKGWLFFIVVSICLAISAVYELVEALASMLTGEAADAFLGTQGYVWDTQTDMLMALVGAVVALLALSRFHNSKINELNNT
jgi:putative membrane protein